MIPSDFTILPCKHNRFGGSVRGKWGFQFRDWVFGIRERRPRTLIPSPGPENRRYFFTTCNAGSQREI
jgi:hypothetical protein